MKVDPVTLQDMTQGSAPAKRFTDQDKRKALAREINLRKSVYPGLIRRGRMTSEQAENEIAVFTEIWNEFDLRVRNGETPAPAQPVEPQDEPQTEQEPAQEPQTQTPAESPDVVKESATASESGDATKEKATAETA